MENGSKISRIKFSLLRAAEATFFAASQVEAKLLRKVDIFSYLLSSRFGLCHLCADILLQLAGEELGLLHAYACLDVLRSHIVQVVVAQMVIERADFVRTQDSALLQLRHEVVAHVFLD